MESRPGQGNRARGGQAAGHYLLRGAPLRRRRARPGPGPRGAGSGSRAAGKAPRVPQTNRGNRWPGRSRWSVASSVPRRGPGPEPPGPPGPSLAPRSPPPAPHRPHRRHLASRPPEAPWRPPQGTPGATVRSAPDQKRLLSWDRDGSQAHIGCAGRAREDGWRMQTILPEAPGSLPGAAAASEDRAAAPS